MASNNEAANRRGREEREESGETQPLLRKSGPAAKSRKTLRSLSPRPIESQDDATDSEAGGDRTADNDDVERQRYAAGNGRRNKLYDGMPEVQTQMKDIMPALAIGVFMAAADMTIIVSSYTKIGSELHALEKTSWIATA